MIGYYFRLGFHQLRRAPVLTLLIVLTLAVGVAASMSTLTVLYVMSGDPIPQKSERLLTPQINNYPVDGGPQDGNLPTLLSWTDVRNLREDGRGQRRSGLYGISGILYPERDGLKNFFVDGVAVDADFFAMMDAPFREGRGWSAAEDSAEARVAVLGTQLARKLFGEGPAVGREVRVDEQRYRVVGVLDRFSPVPKFYRLDGSSRAGAGEDELFIPLSTAIAIEKDVDGTVSCFQQTGPGFQGRLASECVWLRYWVELGSASERSDYEAYLQAYVAEQKTQGRLPRTDARAIARDVREWLVEVGVVDDDVRLQFWLAFGFLFVCLVNTVGLLLAKFTARAADVGVRRALGATRGQIFLQYLSEAAALGLAGSVVGIAGVFGLLRLLASQSPDLEAYAQMDAVMLVTTVLVSVLAAILAGLLPTWRATRVLPAVQLKTQ